MLGRGAGRESAPYYKAYSLQLWGQWKQVCTGRAWVKESAPVEVGGRHLLPPTQGSKRMGLERERRPGPRCESCGRLPLHPHLSVSNTQRNSILKDCILPGLNRPAKDVHPAFLAPSLQDCPSKGLCACAGKETTTRRKQMCVKLLSINDTQTFQLSLLGLFVCLWEPWAQNRAF